MLTVLLPLTSGIRHRAGPRLRYQLVGPSASVISLQFLSAERFESAVGLWFQIRGDNGLARGRV